MNRRLTGLAAFAGFLCLAGCGGEPYKIVPVSGRVTLNGKPLANASVTFAPIAAKGTDEAGPSSVGVTNAEGRFTLKLVGKEQSGVMVGEHVVRIALMGNTPDPADDRPYQERGQLPMKYNAKSELRFTVAPGGTDAADFPLTLP